MGDPIPKMCKVLLLHFAKVFLWRVIVVWDFVLSTYVLVSFLFKINPHKLGPFLDYMHNTSPQFTNQLFIPTSTLHIWYLLILFLKYSYQCWKKKTCTDQHIHILIHEVSQSMHGFLIWNFHFIFYEKMTQIHPKHDQVSRICYIR